MIIYSLTIIFLLAPLFILAVFIALYIPGHLALHKIKLTLFQNIVISTILGMVLWGWQGFIFGFLYGGPHCQHSKRPIFRLSFPPFQNRFQPVFCN